MRMKPFIVSITTYERIQFYATVERHHSRDISTIVSAIK